MPSHRYDEWREALNLLETLTITCYDTVPQTSTVPATSSTNVVASTSGLNIAAAAAAAATSSTTATTTKSTGNHNDEVNTSIVNDDEFGTQNPDFLECELFEDDGSDHSLPDLQVINFKTNPAESDIESDIEQNMESMEITRFRALTEGEKRRSNKYSHVKVDTSIETDSE